MKKLLLLLVLIVVLAGCQKAEEETPKDNFTGCEPSYIPFENGCCLDENNNSLCDYDEPKPKNTSNEKTPPFRVYQKPEEIKYCNISYAINWATVDDVCLLEHESKVTAILMFTGKGEKLDGMWFYATTKNGTEKYIKDENDFTKGDARRYVLELEEPVTRVLALPMLTENGTDKACLNQRMIIIGSEICAKR